MPASTVSPSADAQRRLAFIKYLHSLSLQQAKAEGVQASPALLTLHDAVEMFLQLSGEHLSVTPTPRVDFDKYFPPICAALGEASLPRQAALMRMNKARVSLKHHGLQPAKTDLEAHLRAGADFLEQATPLVFGLSFERLSLAEFVEPLEARTWLMAAVDFREAGELPEACQQLAVAFNVILKAQVQALGWAPDWPHTPMGLSAPGRDSRDLAEAVKYTGEVGLAIVSAVQLLALGINFKRYSHFRSKMPLLQQFGSGPISFVWPRGPSTASAEDVDECIAFVVDCGLRSGL
jgi:hypothetical protein